MALHQDDFYKRIFPEQSDIYLLNMPVSVTGTPSLGLGLLKSNLEKSHYKTAVIYANLLFAEYIGFERWQKVCSLFNYTTNIRDWLFTHSVFPKLQENNEEYLKIVLFELKAINDYYNQEDSFNEEQIKSELIIIRNQATKFIDELASQIAQKKPLIVGCSSVGAQNMASLAILKKVKEISPNIITLMGGANCFGKMGLTIVKNFSWIDFVCTGEGDDNLIPLCKMLLPTGRAVAAETLPVGMFSREKAVLFEKQGLTERNDLLFSIATDLNILPAPDYSEYFLTLKKMPYKKLIKPVLLLESSRGCWWGKCTFCALCSSIKQVRKKNHSAVINEITSLSKRHRIKDIFFVDTILPMNYFKNLIPQLGKQRKKYNLFFEVKANLKEEHIKQLAKANIKWLQPGIEALNDDFLTLMKKGTSTTINLSFLKKSLENSITAIWGLLADFPNEKIEWFNNLAKELPLFHHLQPPVRLNYLMLQRFSHYFESSEYYNLNLKLFPTFQLLYPLPASELNNLSYDFYDDQIGMPTGTQVYSKHQKYKLLIEAIIKWQEVWKKPGKEPILIMKDHKKYIVITDTRDCAVTKKHHFNEIDAKILRLCETRMTQKKIHDKFNITDKPLYTEQNIDDSINRLKKLNILYEQNHRLLNLALKQKQKLSKMQLPKSDQ